MDLLRREKKSLYEASQLSNNNGNMKGKRNLEQQQVSLIEHKKRDNSVSLNINGDDHSSEHDGDDDEHLKIISTNNKNGSNELITTRAKGDKMGSSNRNTTTTTQSASASATNNINKSSHQQTKSRYSRVKWCLLSLMGILLIITAIIIAIISITILMDNEDQCFDQNSPFQQTGYKLFSTKTLYTTAFNYLNKPSSSSSLPTSDSLITTNNNNNINLINNHYDKSSIDLPKIFSTQDTLETIHQRLTSPDYQCEVRQFHYFGRHAARLPSSDEIEKMNQHIKDVQSRIDLSKHQLNVNNQQQLALDQQFNGQLQPEQLPRQMSPTPPSNNTSNDNNTTAKVCFDPLIQYKQWSSFASPEQGNLLMETGGRETLAIARRFKAIYPEMFNGSRANLVFGMTEELRTAQTALIFLKQFDNFKLDVCNLNDFPAEDTSDKSRAGEILQDECFKKFIGKYSLEKLAFHKKCREIAEKEDAPVTLRNFNLKQPNRTEFISKDVSKKLKFTKEQGLTGEESHAIYNACRYESALTGATSIWCNLFQEKHLKFYEYINDIDDYFNQAYGHANQHRSACPVTTQLMRSLRAAPKMAKPEAHFYFTHSEVIQKLLAASVDLEQDPEYEPKRVTENLNFGRVPKSRQWQTSLFTPFSANLAFTLYSCPNADKPKAMPADFMDVTAGNLKLVASLNEQPILLDGCQDFVCDLGFLNFDGRINREKKCKMEDICRSNFVVT